MTELVIEAERLGKGWHCRCANKAAQGKTLSEALQKVVAALGRVREYVGLGWTCPEAGMSGEIGPRAFKRRPPQNEEMNLVGGEGWRLTE